MKAADLKGDQAKSPDMKEVKTIHEERAEWYRQIAMIKKEARSANAGRSYLLPGLRASRLAAQLGQRQLAEAIGGSQKTVGELEGERRGAYIGTIQRLCVALCVTPETLLCCGSDKKQEEAHR